MMQDGLSTLWYSKEGPWRPSSYGHVMMTYPLISVSSLLCTLFFPLYHHNLWAWLQECSFLFICFRPTKYMLCRLMTSLATPNQLCGLDDSFVV